MQPTQDRYMIPVWFQRFEDERIIEAGPVLVGHPVTGRHAMADEATDESGFRIGLRLRQGRRSRHHCLEKWQRERRAGATQNGPPGNMFLSNKHSEASPYD